MKLQFFKTCVLPYFDYCLSLIIYYSKEALQKLCNLYYNILYKLFKLQLMNMEINSVNDYLKRYNLFSFQHRIFYRLSMFSFSSKIREGLKLNVHRNLSYNLRNKENYTVIETNLNVGKKTIEYFFSKFINAFYIRQLCLKLVTFKKFVFDNLNIFFDHFLFIFPHLNLKINIFHHKNIKIGK